jgi:hypothetical protein
MVHKKNKFLVELQAWKYLFLKVSLRIFLSWLDFVLQVIVVNKPGIPLKLLP